MKPHEPSWCNVAERVAVRARIFCETALREPEARGGLEKCPPPLRTSHTRFASSLLKYYPLLGILKSNTCMPRLVLLYIHK